LEATRKKPGIRFDVIADVTPEALLPNFEFALRIACSAESFDVAADGAADDGPCLVALPDIFEGASPCATRKARRVSVRCARRWHSSEDKPAVIHIASFI